VPAPKRVLIRGGGVAACCAMRLLDRRGLPFSVENMPRPLLPAILLGERTQSLIGDVFGNASLFEGLPRIRRRIVKWGDAANTKALPHEAVLVSEQALLERIQPDPTISRREEAYEPTWTICSSGPLRQGSEQLEFGSRIANACQVRLRDGCERDACWIESLDCGWLFLLPGRERGWLLSVGAAAEQLLAKSSLVAEQVLTVDPASGSFSSHPRIAEPLCGPGWMACGAAALGFDPLCGDGVGNATREAILACAVTAAVAGGADEDSALAHYRVRLQAGFMRHLEISREFYRSGGSGPWWREQVEAAERGLEWCRSRLKGVTGFRYRLRGFSLEPSGHG
jgi:hypothetical protein